MNIPPRQEVPQSTPEQILEQIKYQGQARAYDLQKTLRLSNVTIHKHLKKLVEQGKLQKIGKPPLVLYVLPSKQQIATITGRALILDVDTKKYINDHYLYITPSGEMIYGFNGFKEWFRLIKEKEHFGTLAKEYVQICQKAEIHRSNKGWIDATEKLIATFSNNNIKKLYYADFYSIPKFGKTKLGQFVLYAKQSQNKELINLIVKQVKPIIEKIIATHNIDTIVFIPASVPRRIQFMQEFADKLTIPLRTFPLVKSYKGDIIVAQKTLSKLEERIMNARNTIFPRSSLPIIANNVLLIDDAVGSGATLIETAKKIHPTGTIIGFAIVGSIKGFEVIREV